MESRTIGMLYEGDSLEQCLWNVLLDEAECTDEEVKKWMDSPMEGFNHSYYLELLQDQRGFRLEITHSDCIRLVIQK